MSTTRQRFCAIEIWTPGDPSVGIPPDGARLEFDSPVDATEWEEGQFSDMLKEVFRELWDNTDVHIAPEEY